jgi:hypothetical protein
MKIKKLLKCKEKGLHYWKLTQFIHSIIKIRETKTNGINQKRNQRSREINGKKQRIKTRKVMSSITDGVIRYRTFGINKQYKNK